MKKILFLLITLTLGPVNGPAVHAQEKLPDGSTEATTAGAAGGFLLYLKLCGLAAIVGSSPVWLYQIWAFILPGLHRNEKKWTAVFGAIAGPLFLAGIVLGYVTLPKGLEILIGLNPDGLTNLVEFNDYLTFFSRTLLGFGIAFEIPVFVVMLNLAFLIVGVVVVEVIFVYPGMGQYLVDHVSKRDVPVVQACGLVFAAVYIGLNIVADVAGILTNPRLRHPK